MSTITLRSTKGSPLTNTEVDNNFTNLNNDKYQSGDSPSFTALTVTNTGTTTNLTVQSDADQYGGLYFKDTANSGAVLYDHSADRMDFRVGSTNVASFYYSTAAKTVVFNEGSNDQDFRVESDTNTHALFVDAGAGKVMFGTSTTVNGANGEFTLGGGASSTTYFSIRNTTTGPTTSASSRLDLGVWTNNANYYLPSGTTTGTVNFMAQANDNGYAASAISSYILTGGNLGRSSHTARTIFYNKDTSAASALEYMCFDGGERSVVLNQHSYDRDFRVESDNISHALFVNGNNGRVGIGSEATVGVLSIYRDGWSTNHNDSHILLRNANNTTGDKALISTTFSSSVNGAGFVPVAFGGLNVDAGTPRDGAFAVYVADYDNVDLSTDERFRVHQSGADVYGKLTATNINDVWSAHIKGSTWSRLCYFSTTENVVTGGSFLFNIRHTRNSVVYNVTGILNFSHSYKATIGILSNPRYTGITLRAVVDTYGRGFLEMYEAGANMPAEGVDNVRVTLTHLDPGLSITKYTDFTNGTTIPTDYAERAYTQCYDLSFGDRNFASQEDEVVVNDQSNDVDFRVESDANANMLFVDGGNNKVVIGTNVVPNVSASSSRTYDLVVNNGISIGSDTYTHGYIGHSGEAGNVTIAANAYPAYTSLDHSVKIAAGNAGGGGPLEVARFSGENGAIFNEGSLDRDFRVETDGYSSALFVNGGSNKIDHNVITEVTQPIFNHISDSGTNYFTHLCTGSFYNGSGAIFITTNIPGHNVSGNGNMFAIRIFGYSYGGDGPINLQIGLYAGEGGFYSTTLSGTYPSKWRDSVYVYTDANGKVAFQLGETGDTQSCEIAVAEFVQGFSNVNYTYARGWSTGVGTSLPTQNNKTNLTTVNTSTAYSPEYRIIDNDLYVDGKITQTANSFRVGRVRYNWFSYGGNPSNRYMHIKTTLNAGGGGNSQPTMSMFHIKGYNYDGQNFDGMIGFHNWNGVIYSKALTNNSSRSAASNAYVSSDGYVVLVVDCGTSYPGFSIDHHQNYPYTYIDVGVTTYGSYSSTTGAY